MMRLLCVMALTGAAALSACGGNEQPAAKPAPGTPENPLVAQSTDQQTTARSNEATAGAPSYDRLLDGQSNRPEERFTPCNLVTRAEARAIFGEPVEPPLEGSQGPTCVYRSRSGDRFATLALQTIELGKLKREIAQRRQVQVGDEAAVCGNHGQPMLYVPLADGRVLSIAGPCDVARRFATKALAQLG
jgi:hypothetical protein